MEKLAIGLWGCFYGASFLVLCGAAFAYSRSMHRIGVNLALTVLGTVVAVSVFLGGLHIFEHDVLLRIVAHLKIVVGLLLVYQLLNVLGLGRPSKNGRQTKMLFSIICTAILGASWMLTPSNALLMCDVAALAMASFAGVVSIRKALRGDRLAWVAVFTVVVVIVAAGVLSYDALQPQRWSWQVHAVTAAVTTAFMIALGRIGIARYSYLLEYKKVMEYGPAYDPVTRLRSRSETGQMARDIFNKLPHDNEPLGVMVLTIANLYTLEKLHGAAAVNSALFLIASRLKRSLPSRVEIGRLGFDGFLLIMRNCADSIRLIELAHELNRSIHKSATLKTNPDAEQLETAQMVWLAQAGIGVLHVKNFATSSFDAITMARNMSRTAISYSSCIAWFDEEEGQISELPARALLL